MPRKAKDETKMLEKKIVKEGPTSKKTTSKKQSTSTTKNNIKKETPSKKKTDNINKNTKISASKKKTTSIKKTPKKTVSSKNKKLEVLEYYDLPYHYNQTVVKILAQTPNTLFIYWDISDKDKNKYIEQYGEYFFYNTKPVLLIYNKTKHYHFEVDINDFANSWYLHTVDSNCDYQIELGRRPINEHIHISNNYINITTSNNIESPNDHILFEKLSHFVYFKNVKTNKKSKKDITNLSFLNKIGKFVSIKEFYQKLYKNECIGFDKVDLRNPSSN